MTSVSVGSTNAMYRQLTGIKYKINDDGHHQNPVVKVFKMAFNRLRSVDGIDEVSSAAGQLLPGIAGPLVSASILAPATPLVAMGAAGAVSDSIKRFGSEYPTTLNELLNRQQRIINFFEGSAPNSVNRVPSEQLANLKKYNNQLKKIVEIYDDKKNAKSIFGAIKAFDKGELKKTLKALNPLNNAGGGTASRHFLQEALLLANTNKQHLSAEQHENLLYEISQCQRQETQRHIERIDRDFSVPGAGAMVGMTAGMLPATAGAMAGIAHEAGSVAAEGVGGILGTVSGAVFLPAQAAMATYGASKMVTGVMREQQFKADKRVVKELSTDLHIDKNVAKSVAEVIDRKRYYNAHHSIAYGTATAVGQGFMMAGNISTMSGAGVLVAAPLFAVGVPLTLGSAVQRVIYEKKEEVLVGEGASAGAEAAAEQLDIDNLVAEHGVLAATKMTAQKYQTIQDKLVRIKLYSFLDHILKKEEAHEKRHARRVGSTNEPFHLTEVDQLALRARQSGERAVRMEDMVANGKKSLFKGTSLGKEDIRLMGDVFDKEGRKFIYGTTAEVRDAMRSKLQEKQMWVGDAEAEVEKKALRATVKKLIKKSRHDEAIKDFLRTPLPLAKDNDSVKINQVGKTVVDQSTQTEKPNQRTITLAELKQFAATNQTASRKYHKELATRMTKQIKTDMKFLRHDAAQKLANGAHSLHAINVDRKKED